MSIIYLLFIVFKSNSNYFNKTLKPRVSVKSMSYSKRHLGLSIKAKWLLINYKKASYFLALQLNEARGKNGDKNNDELITKIETFLISLMIKIHSRLLSRPTTTKIS